MRAGHPTHSLHPFIAWPRSPVSVWMLEINSIIVLGRPRSLLHPAGMSGDVPGMWGGGEVLKTWKTSNKLANCTSETLIYFPFIPTT